MDKLKLLLGQVRSAAGEYLASHPELRDLISDAGRQFRAFWEITRQNTPSSLVFSLVLLTVLLLTLITARLFARSGMMTLALKFLPRALYRKSMIGRAELFAREGSFVHAGELFQAVGEAERAVTMYVRGEQYRQAARLYLDTGKFREAARIFEEGKDFSEAAKYYEKGEMFYKAGEMYNMTRDFLKSAENFDRAIQQLESGGDSPETRRKIEEYATRGGDLFLKAKEFQRAGDLLEKAGQFEQAALAFSRAKQPLHSARNLEKGEKYREAAKLYFENGELQKSAACYEKGGGYAEAGGIYHQLGETDRAISQFQKVTSQSKSYEEVTRMLGNLFEAKGMWGPAREKYQKLVERKGVNRENLETYYNLALLTEKMGDLNEAISIFEKIIAEDMNYKDVASKLDSIKERAKQTAGLTPEETEARTLTSRYRILEELGRGGMGIVYKAEDVVLKRVVAYKMLTDSFKDNPQFLESFMQEARTSAALNHPNIVTLYDTGRAGNNYYLTMEYLDGMTLKQLLVKARGAVPVWLVLVAARQIALGLEYAHERSVIHRDIKPANIMLMKDKGVKIMDFGLAKLLHEGASEKTSVKGTPYYMSPEQILGQNVDGQTDLYALGCTLYHLLTGRPPFSEGDIYYHHLNTEPESPSKFNSKIPHELSNLVMKALKKKKGERFATPGEILADLKTITPEPAKK